MTAWLSEWPVGRLRDQVARVPHPEIVAELKTLHVSGQQNGHFRGITGGVGSRSAVAGIYVAALQAAARAREKRLPTPFSMIAESMLNML